MSEWFDRRTLSDWVRNPVPLGHGLNSLNYRRSRSTPRTGEITVRDNAELDYETGSSPFSYVIQVFDGLNVVPVTVTIDLNPINDNAPIFDPVGPFSIAEDALLGAVVGSVSATDADLPADNAHVLRDSRRCGRNDLRDRSDFRTDHS